MPTLLCIVLIAVVCIMAGTIIVYFMNQSKSSNKGGASLSASQIKQIIWSSSHWSKLQEQIQALSIFTRNQNKKNEDLERKISQLDSQCKRQAEQINDLCKKVDSLMEQAKSTTPAQKEETHIQEEVRFQGLHSASATAPAKEPVPAPTPAPAPAPEPAKYIYAEHYDGNILRECSKSEAYYEIELTSPNSGKLDYCGNVEKAIRRRSEIFDGVFETQNPSMSATGFTTVLGTVQKQGTDEWIVTTKGIIKFS